MNLRFIYRTNDIWLSDLLNPKQTKKKFNLAFAQFGKMCSQNGQFSAHLANLHLLLILKHFSGQHIDRSIWRCSWSTRRCLDFQSSPWLPLLNDISCDSGNCKLKALWYLVCRLSVACKHQLASFLDPQSAA